MGRPRLRPIEEYEVLTSEDINLAVWDHFIPFPQPKTICNYFKNAGSTERKIVAIKWFLEEFSWIKIVKCKKSKKCGVCSKI